MLSLSPFVMVIFGATGDLMDRKLMPALYTLYRRQLISPQSFIVGVGRREISTDEFRSQMLLSAQRGNPDEFDLNVWGTFADGIYYSQGYFEDPELYQRIVRLLARFDETMHACVPRYFYLATPPQNYEPILKHLETSELSEGCGQGTINFTRVLIEKPFGSDLPTALHLEKLLSSVFEEKQIYRIDHYLGKETVQNILAFRFGNGIFEPTWNREFIDHIQIHLAEEIGVGNRGSFYDGIGALRDVVQNHMLQMLSLVAMEQPRGFSAQSVRDARSEAIKSIILPPPAQALRQSVRGRYIGYTSEHGVSTHSRTETFVALKVAVKSPRWNGVPFYLRTGKRLERKTTEISLHFKKPVCPDDICLFDQSKIVRNVLSIHIQPEEGIHLRLMVKKPGYGMELAPTNMGFHYKMAFPQDSQPEAYERLLLDAISGDQTLFARTDEIGSSWKFMMSFIDAWSSVRTRIHPYTTGSWGPPPADALIEKDNRHWFLGH